MCTIVIANHISKQFPLIIGANRDEDYNRTSTPPCVLSNDPHLIIGGKDKEKGGTWLAVNKHSLFAAITNQGPKDNAKATSRGSIVIDALKCSTLDEMIAFVEGFNPEPYNGFNLVFGNQHKLYVAHSYIMHAMVISELPVGISIIGSDMTFTGQTDKSAYIHDVLEDDFADYGMGVAETPKHWLGTYKTLKKLLANEDYNIKIRPTKKNGKLQSRCTRSSSILAFDEAGLARYKFHDRTGYVIERKKIGPDANMPRYRDYVDLWRKPETFDMNSVVSEENEKDDTTGKVLGTKESAKIANKVNYVRYSLDPITWKPLGHSTGGRWSRE